MAFSSRRPIPEMGLPRCTPNQGTDVASELATVLRSLLRFSRSTQLEEQRRRALTVQGRSDQSNPFPFTIL
jgi:hypothetical protein